jgi:hypothetical protein
MRGGGGLSRMFFQLMRNRGSQLPINATLGFVCWNWGTALRGVALPC